MPVESPMTNPSTRIESTRDPAVIIADLLATSLMPSDGWESARPPYVWEREGLDYLAARKRQGDRPPINAWTAMLVEEGYPAAKAGDAQGKFWTPPPPGEQPSMIEG